MASRSTRYLYQIATRSRPTHPITCSRPPLCICSSSAQVEEEPLSDEVRQRSGNVCAAGGQVWVGLSGDAAGLGWYGLRLRRPESSRGLPRGPRFASTGIARGRGNWIGWAGLRRAGAGLKAVRGCGARRVGAGWSGEVRWRRGPGGRGADAARWGEQAGPLVVGRLRRQWVREMNSPVWVARTWPPGWSAGRVSDEVRTGRRVPSGAMRTVLGASSTTNSLALRRTTGAL
jgi:hypothetical protein